MDVTFIYNGHEIVLCRPFEEMYLVIDGKRTDGVKGIFKKDHDALLKGKIDNIDGTIDLVEVEYKSGGLKKIHGTAALWINGQKIDVRNTT